MHASTSKRVLSVFSLVMINVIAVDSLRTVAITAKLGLSLVSYYLIAACIFFIPVALVAAELATAYPNRGGLYVWVREAFGKRAGFMTIWLQWVYNIVWYPTIMAFITGTLSYSFAVNLANSKTYLLTSSIGLFWLFTLLNCFGMRLSGIVSTIGAIFGTILPMVGIIILGFIWYLSGHPIHLGEDASILPHLNTWGNLPLFGAVLFGLLGMEMSAVHAEEVKNPQRDYPRALFFSTLIIFSTLVFSSLAVIIVIPNEQLSLVSGFIDAYSVFFNLFHMPWMTVIIAILISVGGLSCVSAWIIGPTKGLLVAAQDGSLPARFGQTNRFGAPWLILITQGLIFTILTSVFILFDSVNVAYWLLSDLCDQMALLVYVFMFAAAIRLRYRNPEHRGAYRIPGSNTVMWIIAGTGILCCVGTLLAGFIPPDSIPVSNYVYFESFLIGGLSIFLLLPWLLSKKRHLPLVGSE